MLDEHSARARGERRPSRPSPESNAQFVVPPAYDPDRKTACVT